jgi:hypothetical protein
VSYQVVVDMPVKVFLFSSAISSTWIRHASKRALKTDHIAATCQLPNTKGNKAISPVTMM